MQTHRKTCRTCGAEFTKRDRDSWDQWAARVVCSRSCRPSLSARLWARVVVGAPDACWLWTGGVTSTGYGGVKLGRRSMGAHVAAWEEAHGPVPSGMDVHHWCEVKRCCNVNHMEVLPHSEHTRITDGGAHNRVKTHCPQGHPYSGANLYVGPKGGRACRICLRAADLRRKARNRVA